MVCSPERTPSPPITRTSPAPTASTSPLRGAQRDSVSTAAISTASSSALCRPKSCRARSNRPNACTAATLRTRSVVTPLRRPAAARAAPWVRRTTRRWRTESAASTGTTTRPRSARPGSSTSRSSSTPITASRSGTRVTVVATTASSSRPTSVVSRDTQLAAADATVPAQRQSQGVFEDRRPQPGTDPFRRALAGSGRHHVEQSAHGRDQHGGESGGDQHDLRRGPGQPRVKGTGVERIVDRQRQRPRPGEISADPQHRREAGPDRGRSSARTGAESTRCRELDMSSTLFRWTGSGQCTLVLGPSYGRRTTRSGRPRHYDPSMVRARTDDAPAPGARARSIDDRHRSRSARWCSASPWPGCWSRR